MKPFLLSASGAVSVYVVLIIVPVFLFQAVYVDFARIKAAEKETEAAVRTALRSTMSMFDKQLQQIGLFGLEASREEAEGVFRTVFAQNLSSAVSKGGFRYLDVQAVELAGRVTPVYSLASHIVFQRQLLEDMKLRAPVEFMLQIADKFKADETAAALQNGSSFAHWSDAVEAHLLRREAALDSAWKVCRRLHETISANYSLYHKRIAELSGMAERIGTRSVEEVRSGIAQLISERHAASESIRQKEAALAALQQEPEANASTIDHLRQAQYALEARERELAIKQSELEALLELVLAYTELVGQTRYEALSHKAAIVQLQRELEQFIGQAKKENEAVQAELRSLNKERSLTEGGFQVFGHVAVYGDDYFDSYQTAAASTAALFSAFQEMIESTLYYTPSQAGKAAAGNEAYRNYEQAFFSRQQGIEMARLNKQAAVEASKKEAKNNIQSVLDRAKQSIGGCGVLSGESLENDAYAQLQGGKAGFTKGLYFKYMEINGENDAGEIRSAVELEKPEQLSLQSMGMLQSLLSAAEVIRNELYVNEYALTRFNYRTYGQDSGGVQQTSQFESPASHMLQQQEAEYLLYGFASCAANLSSAYAEMFAFRLAIRTVEALLDPDKQALNAGSPMLVLLAAAAEGAAKALSDMEQLTAGKQVELAEKFSSTAVTLNYKDYLRLFLLLHSADTKLLSRIQALIELNSGKDLLKETTYMQGTAQSSVKLWFLPSIMKVLDNFHLLGCEVAGNRCTFTRTAIWSY